CKTVLISQEIEDGIIEVNELVTYNVTVNAVNNLGEDILDAMLKDNFGGDVEIIPQANNVTETGVLSDPDCDVKLKGKTDKAQVRCDIGTFADGQEAGFTANVQTDINPGQGKKDVPKREYTSCGIHDMNSGATLNGVFANGTSVEFSTGNVSVEVFEFADLSGDCDVDGLTDDVDPEPFVFNDEDGDGIGDGFDQCPFEADLGNGFDEFGCAILDP
ncbi:MAG: hypothetical protein PVI88_07670, partial [Nitrosopumilaceae archaeon]